MVRRKCKRCGEENTTESTYCPVCGGETYAIYENESRDTSAESWGGVKKKDRSPVVAVIAILISIAVGILGFLLLKFVPEDETVKFDKFEEIMPGGLADTLAEIAVEIDLPEPPPGVPIQLPKFPSTDDVHLGKYISEGPSPEGEVAWIENLGESVIGSPVSIDGKLFVVVETIKDDVERIVPEAFTDLRNDLCYVDPEDGSVIWRSKLTDGEKLKDAQILVDGSSVYVVTRPIDRDLSKITESDIAKMAEDEVPYWRVAIFHLQAGSGVPLWSDNVEIMHEFLVGAAVLDDMICVSTWKTDEITRVIRGIDSRNGETIWSMAFEGFVRTPGLAGNYFSVARYENGIHGLSATISLIDPETGEEKFKQWTGFTGPSISPLHIGDGILCGGVQDDRKLMYEYIKPSGGEEIGWNWEEKLTRWEKWDRWSGSIIAPLFDPVVIGGYLFHVSPGLRPIVLRMDSGKEVNTIDWEITDVVWAPVSNGEKVFYLSRLGRIATVDVETLEAGWLCDLPEGFQPLLGTDVSYADGRIFITGREGQLLCVE